MDTSRLFDLRDAVDLLNSQTQRSDSLWSMYWLVTAAVLGFGYGREVVRKNNGVKLGLSFAFAVFSFINIGALWYTQKTLASICRGFSKVTSDQTVVNPVFAESLGSITRATQWEMLCFHVFVDLCILSALWLPNLYARKRGAGV